MRPGEGNLDEILASLITEAPDILCSYAECTAAALWQPTSVAMRPGERCEAMEQWIALGQALALDRILAGRLPDLPRSSVRQRVSWSLEGEGEIDPVLAAYALAQGCPQGLPYLVSKRDSVAPEVLMLAAGLSDAIGTLAGLQHAWRHRSAGLTASALEARGRLERVQRGLHAIHPGLPFRGSAQGAARTVLSRLHNTHRSRQIRELAVLLSASPRSGIFLSGDGQELLAPGGEDFADKALELLMLGRLRSYFAPAGTPHIWYGNRLIGSKGHPVLETTLRGDPLSVWFQTSRGLSKSATTSTARRTTLGRGIPDIVIVHGQPGAQRTVIMDAKNYADTTGLAREAQSMLGDSMARGMTDHRIALVRPAETAGAETETGPDFTIVYASMPLGAAGALLPGQVAGALLA